MAQPLDDVLGAFTPEQRARAEARAQERMEEALTLRDLRQAHHLTQERMAELLGVEQENISRNETSPQQAAGYQKENRLLMRHHGFSNSSL